MMNNCINDIIPYPLSSLKPPGKNVGQILQNISDIKIRFRYDFFDILFRINDKYGEIRYNVI